MMTIIVTTFLALSLSQATVGAFSGQIKATHGLCLDASQRSTPRGKVHMWPCDKNNKNQHWTYTPSTGQIKATHGLCLDASQRSSTGGKVLMWPCDTNNKNQHWTYTSSTGQIKATYGICLDAMERSKTGGKVHMWNCNTNNKNQMWTAGESAAPPTAVAQCNKPEVLKKCIAWGQWSKEDNGCKAYANGWKKRSNGCHSCSSTRREYLACDLDQCTAFCGEMYRNQSGDKNRCVTGCEKYAELLEASNVYAKGIKGRSSNSCPKGYGHIKTHAECKLAGEALDASLHRTPSGSWGHVPPYCSYQSGGDKSVHFNKKSSGNNDGGYTPICKRNPEGIDKDLKTAVPHTMDMISLNVKIYNVAAKPGTIVTAKTTNNKWKVAQVMTSEDSNGRGGRLWLAELEDLRTCAIVVRGTNDAKVFLYNLSLEEDDMPGTSYKVMKGYQQHILEILSTNNNQNKLYAWLQKCNDRGFKKIISGHSLGGAVATWLSIHLETKKEPLRADYVVTFGAPRLVMRYGDDKCPKSLQTRTRAVRIVTATTKLLGNFVDAAATMPGEMWHDHKEAFCFESMSLDGYGNILKQDDQWPNWSYEFVSNHMLGGWDLHGAESRYEPFLLKAKEKKARGGKCYGGGTWCDDWGNFWGKGSCEKVCCHGAQWKLTHHVCKAESTKCLSSGTWCDFFGILTDSCGSCCSRGHHYVWWKLRHECN